MVNVAELANTARMFNGIEVGDRIIYRHKNSLDNKVIKTRRVIKVNDKSVVVMENGKKTRIGWNAIIMA